MNKALFLVFLLSVLFLISSCRKTIDLADDEGVSFLVRLPSIALARFEAHCVSEDVFLDQVKVQSPNSSYIIEEFGHQRYAKDELFLFGNSEAEDGLWLITFIGTSAITDEEFHQIVPCEMNIAADDNDE